MLLKSYQSCHALSGITYSITASSVILYVKMNLSPIQPVSLFDSVRDATVKLFVNITIHHYMCKFDDTVTELGS